MKSFIHKAFLKKEWTFILCILGFTLCCNKISKASDRPESSKSSGGITISFNPAHNDTVIKIICLLSPPYIYGTSDAAITHRWLKGTGNPITWDTIENASDTNYQIASSDMIPGIPNYFQRVAFFQYETVLSNILRIIPYAQSYGGTQTTPESEICLKSSCIITLHERHGDIVHWEKKITSSTIWNTIAFTDSVLTDTPPISGIWQYRVLVRSGVCNPVYSDTLSVTVKQKPQGYAVPNNNILCSDEQVIITLNPVIHNTSYSWSRNHINDISGSIPVQDTTNPIHGTLISSSNQPVDVVFSCKILVDGCSSDTFRVTISVKPKPQISQIIGEATSCSQTKKYSIDSVIDYSYHWSVLPTALGTIISGIDKPQATVFWNVVQAQQNGTIINNITNTYQCSSADTLPITIFPGIAPEHENLVRKHTQDTSELFLLCQKYINDSAQNLTFSWGYLDESGQSHQNPTFNDLYFCRWENYQPQYNYFLDLSFTGSSAGCKARFFYTPPPNKTTDSRIENNVTIFPNPSEGKFVVSVNNQYVEQVEFKMYSLVGEVTIFTKTERLSIGDKLYIDLPSYIKGSYIASVKRGSGERIFTKIIIL